jgi:hypothetical protein
MGENDLKEEIPLTALMHENLFDLLSRLGVRP